APDPGDQLVQRLAEAFARAPCDDQRTTCDGDPGLRGVASMIEFEDRFDAEDPWLEAGEVTESRLGTADDRRGNRAAACRDHDVHVASRARMNYDATFGCARRAGLRLAANRLERSGSPSIRVQRRPTVGARRARAGHFTGASES